MIWLIALLWTTPAGCRRTTQAAPRPQSAQSWLHSGHRSDWFTYLEDPDGPAPSRVHVDMGLERTGNRPEGYVASYEVDFRLLDPGPDGLGTASEEAEVSAIIEALNTALGAHPMVMVAHVRQGGRATVLFYGEGHQTPTFYEAVSANVPVERKSVASARIDVGWRLFRLLSPPRKGPP